MGRHEDIEAVLEAAAGPLTWHNSDHATGHVDGFPVLLSKRYTKGNDRLRLNSVWVACDLGGRPVRLKVDETSLGRSRSNSMVDTGDPGFDDPMQLYGWPAEACRAALDADARRYLVQTFDKKWPYVDTVDGRLRMARTVIFERPDRLADPLEIAETARHVQRMGSRLVAAYDAMYAEVHRTQGPEAAQAFHDEHVEKWSGHRTRRVGKLLLVGLGVAALTTAMMWLAIATGQF